MQADSRLPKRLFTVVIASVCSNDRSDLLKRACDSVRAMAGRLDYSIIVVANGPRVSPDVIEWLEGRPEILVVRLQTGSYPLARRVGAELANSEFLGFLDDDDELLPDSLARKVSYFRQHPEVDVLVTDGLRRNGASETRIFPPPDKRSADLVVTMMHTGWGACAMTLRAQAVDLAAFDPLFRQMEWTLTTLKLARRHRFGYLDEPTYRYFETTPNSLSKSSEHVLAAPEVWRRLLVDYRGTPYETTVRKRYARECHNAAQVYRQLGRSAEAWCMHLTSLRSPGGLAYLSFTRRLLLPSSRSANVDRTPKEPPLSTNRFI